MTTGSVEPITARSTGSITVFSLLRPPLATRPPGGVHLQRLRFWVARVTKPTAIRRLSFIHFARLVIIRRFPDHGQPPEDVPHPLLLFESNYDGGFDAYIDTFAEAVPDNMDQLWGTSYGWPGVEPVWRFKEYINANLFEVQHHYSAHADATTSEIVSALELAERHAELRRRAATLDPAAFRDEYLAFLTRVQEDL